MNAAVERHAALPHFENLERMSGELRQVVEQHIADAAAEHDAERHPEDEIVVVGDRERRRSAPQPFARDDRAGIEPAEQDAEDIGERVPADGKRPDRDQHRMESGEGDDRRTASRAPSGFDARSWQRRSLSAPPPCDGAPPSPFCTRMQAGAARFRWTTFGDEHGPDHQPLLRRVARLMNDAAGAAQGVRREAETLFRTQAERILRDLDVVQREEFEAVKEMARLAREENEALKARVAAWKRSSPASRRRRRRPAPPAATPPGPPAVANASCPRPGREFRPAASAVSGIARAFLVFPPRAAISRDRAALGTPGGCRASDRETVTFCP